MSRFSVRSTSAAAHLKMPGACGHAKPADIWKFAEHGHACASCARQTAPRVAATAASRCRPPRGGGDGGAARRGAAARAAATRQRVDMPAHRKRVPLSPSSRGALGNAPPLAGAGGGRPPSSAALSCSMAAYAAGAHCGGGGARRACGSLCVRAGGPSPKKRQSTGAPSERHGGAFTPLPICPKLHPNKGCSRPPARMP
jgi:hypothetical protein